MYVPLDVCWQSWTCVFKWATLPLYIHCCAWPRTCRLPIQSEEKINSTVILKTKLFTFVTHEEPTGRAWKIWWWSKFVVVCSRYNSAVCSDLYDLYVAQRVSLWSFWKMAQHFLLQSTYKRMWFGAGTGTRRKRHRIYVSERESVKITCKAWDLLRRSAATSWW